MLSNEEFTDQIMRAGDGTILAFANFKDAILGNRLKHAREYQRKGERYKNFTKRFIAKHREDPAVSNTFLEIMTNAIYGDLK